MKQRTLGLVSAICLQLAAGCGSEQQDDELLSSHTLALNACDETVPPARHIDGFPAYA